MAESSIYLGFDFGYAHIGVAVGQTATCHARPLTSLKAQNGAPDWQQIQQLIDKWQPAGLIVGVPLNMDGTEQHTTQAARRFARRLEGRFQLRVHNAEERLTTQQAKAQLFEQYGYRALTKQAIDSWSASIILQSWLQNHFDK